MIKRQASKTNIRQLRREDLKATASVHAAAFPRQTLSYEWLACTLAAFPRYLCFIVEDESAVCGYIVWSQKSGFRPEVVLELEQIAVHPELQGLGLGRRLILETLPQVQAQLAAQGGQVKHVMVTTRADNRAQALYASTLGARVEACITDLYSSDEVLMIARDVGELGSPRSL